MFLKNVSEQLLLKDDFDPAVLKDVPKNNVPTPDDFEEGAPSGVFGEGLPSLRLVPKMIQTQVQVLRPWFLTPTPNQVREGNGKPGR